MLTALTGYRSYQGRLGHPYFILHRITGLGLFAYLTFHILSTSLVFFAPSWYEKLIPIFNSIPVEIGQIFLIFCVYFHGANGLRIVYFDLFAHQWTISAQHKWNKAVWVMTFIFWIPSIVFMVRSLLMQYFGLFGG